MTRPILPNEFSAFSSYDEEEYTSRSWAKGDPYSSNLAYRILTYGCAAVGIVGILFWWLA